MPNIPGTNNILPSVVTDITTNSTGVATTTGIRVSCIVGEGLRSEVVVASALGGGQDGFNSKFTSTNGAVGRFFSLAFSPIISNRTTLFKNGIPLVGQESTSVGTGTFSDTYDYRIDINTGHIELQTAHLVDLGGSFFQAALTNVGIGSLDGYGGVGIKLVDSNAPSETWTIKCISVQRNSMNQVLAGTAKFIAFGSISGNILDASGNVITWTADSQNYSNGILTFNIVESTNSSGQVISPFREGDSFTIKVAGGSLVKNDSLTATYIAVSDINDPTFFTNMKSLTAKHGSVSLSNNLSLGAQLAFDNGTPGVLAMQAAPPLPRRTSYELETDFNANSTNVNDFVIPFPVGVVPDLNSNIHIFVANTSTGIETELLANKFPFYTIGTSGNPTLQQFIFSDINPPAGWDFSYSVVQANETVAFAQDGYMNVANYNTSTPLVAQFSSSSLQFNLLHVGKNLVVIDADNLTNVGTFAISSVNSGIATVSAGSFTAFVADTGVSFQLINPNTGAVIVSGSDGALSTIGGSQGSFTSASTDFSSYPLINGYLLKVTSSTSLSNVGTFEVYSNPSQHVIDIQKCFVSESNLKFEVQDSTLTSDYLVLNHNIVPDGNNLRVTIVDERDAGFFDAGWLNVLSTLEAFELDILVPLPKQTASVIFQNCLTHCITMSNNQNKKERVLFIGAINGLTPDNLTGAKDAAVEDIGVIEGIQGDSVAEILAGNTEDLANYSVSDAFGTTFRCMYFFPDQIVVQVGSDNTIIDGFYLAAAAAGFFSATSNIAMPLTNKVLSGFTILKNRQFSNKIIGKLAAAGVAVVQPVAGGGRVVWGLTTTQSGFPEEQEASIVFIRDRVAKNLRAGFGGFIGLPEDSDTVALLTARAVSLLKSFIGQKLITDYANLSVARDSVEPRQWNVGVFVQPVYSINWIYISVGIGTLPSA